MFMIGIFNSGYDENSNPKDSAGYSYDRNSGSHLGRVNRKENFGERFLGKLAAISLIIYIFPGYINNFTRHHPALRVIFLVILFIWVFRRIRRIFKRVLSPNR
jgi:hypothetical protein